MIYVKAKNIVINFIVLAAILIGGILLFTEGFLRIVQDDALGNLNLDPGMSMRYLGYIVLLTVLYIIYKAINFVLRLFTGR